MELLTLSFFQSGKNGDATEVERARKVVSHVKAGRIDFLGRFYNEMMTETDKEILSQFISKEATLIPLPKSAPLIEGAQWPPKEICKFLISKGYGNTISTLLQRTKVVPKAAFQENAEERPSVQKHYETIEVVKGHVYPIGVSEIILVDDVVTQGRMGYGCYLRLSEIFPDIPIKLFCLVRTNTFRDIEKCIYPKLTKITYNKETGKTFHIDN
jgi:hypothetical protein